ncbi:MAG TPA: ATP-binding protein [Bacteroidia bacterium]|nr:ATP-binding protein [Bacteroidia bacterium]
MLNKRNTFITLLLIFIVAGRFALAQDDSTGNDRPKQLNEYLQEATELYNGFKNWPAFEVLQKYGELKEKELNKQKEETLNQLESKFKTDYSRRKQELTDTQTAVDELKKENDSLEKEKQKLTRNTFLFFVILISLLTGILISRTRLAKKAKALADISSVQLNRTIKLADISGNISKMNADLKFGFRSVWELSGKSIPLISKLKSIAVNQKKKMEDFQKLEESINLVYEDSEQAVSSLSYNERTVSDIKEEKVITNLNSLINEVFDISFHWIKSYDDSFDCSKVKDLEKILPEISIMPVAIRTALFHFFNNAFYSVYEKKKSAGKSYEPKISVTSRKLPRFVQIRIKDNGSGIEDKILSRIYDPFFTSKPPDKASGLGLTHAAEIIKKKHGGEIIIESEPGKGSDFIIRFPINTPM